MLMAARDILLVIYFTLRYMSFNLLWRQLARKKKLPLCVYALWDIFPLVLFLFFVSHFVWCEIKEDNENLISNLRCQEEEVRLVILSFHLLFSISFSCACFISGTKKGFWRPKYNYWPIVSIKSPLAPFASVFVQQTVLCENCTILNIWSEIGH
jgi:hypothetical protein